MVHVTNTYYNFLKELQSLQRIRGRCVDLVPPLLIATLERVNALHFLKDKNSYTHFVTHIFSLKSVCNRVLITNTNYNFLKELQSIQHIKGRCFSLGPPLPIANSEIVLKCFVFFIKNCYIHIFKTEIRKLKP